MTRPARHRPGPWSVGVLYNSALTPEQAARAATIAAGCTCEPGITIAGVHARIAHDDDCVLLRRLDRN